MTFRLEGPKCFAPELAYTFQVLLNDLFGLKLADDVQDAKQVALVLPEGQKIIFETGLFKLTPEVFYSYSAISGFDVTRWRVPPAFQTSGIPDDLPLITSQGEDKSVPFAILSSDSQEIRVGGDLPGTAFFWLSRIEEYLRPECDRHGRFPGALSLAYRTGLLQRPVVNHMAAFVIRAIQILAPHTPIREGQYKVVMTHDVDRPFSTIGRRVRKLPRIIASDLLKRRSPILAFRRIIGAIAGIGGSTRYDPNNTFLFLMDMAEKWGVECHFYFIFGTRHEVIAEHYDPSNPLILEIIRQAAARGHRIGLHPSYETWRDPVLLREEVDRMFEIVRQEGIEQDHWGGRQHILRWDPAETWAHWDMLGLDYDSTMHYAGLPGFRTGCCSEHSVFDIKTRRSLNIRQRPLMAMDVSFTNYLNYGHKETLTSIEEMANNVRAVNGTLILLWHQDSLVRPADKKFYNQLLEKLV
jgi:hypothetical protein